MTTQDILIARRIDSLKTREEVVDRFDELKQPALINDASSDSSLSWLIHKTFNLLSEPKAVAFSLSGQVWVFEESRNEWTRIEKVSLSSWLVTLVMVILTASRPISIMTDKVQPTVKAKTVADQGTLYDVVFGDVFTATFLHQGNQVMFLTAAAGKDILEAKSLATEADVVKLFADLDVKKFMV